MAWHVKRRTDRGKKEEKGGKTLSCSIPETLILIIHSHPGIVGWVGMGGKPMPKPKAQTKPKPKLLPYGFVAIHKVHSHQSSQSGIAIGGKEWQTHDTHQYRAFCIVEAILIRRVQQGQELTVDGRILLKNVGVREDSRTDHLLID